MELVWAALGAWVLVSFVTDSNALGAIAAGAVLFGAISIGGTPDTSYEEIQTELLEPRTEEPVCDEWCQQERDT